MSPTMFTVLVCVYISFFLAIILLKSNDQKASDLSEMRKSTIYPAYRTVARIIAGIIWILSIAFFTIGAILMHQCFKEDTQLWIDIFWYSGQFLLILSAIALFLGRLAYEMLYMIADIADSTVNMNFKIEE
jgi:hypothetical protein